MVIIRLILLALVPVYLADGLSDGSKESFIPADITLAEVCNSYINGWYTKPPVPTRRIHKFINAEPGTFPFMGALGWRFKGSTKYGFRCAGTLINEKFILTAAHCAILELNLSKQFVSQKPEIVAFGIENIAEVNTVTEPRQPKVVNIKKMIQHPKYHSPMRYHDIALIESDVNIEFTDFVYPACLWAQDHNPDFEIKPVLVGWQFDGSSDIPIAKAERLKYGKVDLVDNHNCNKMIEMKNQSKRLFKDGIIDGQLCAQGAIEGDTCKDNSGGPLLYFGPIKRYFPTVVGVTSFGFMGKECGGLDLFGIYTRVSQYVDWIARVAFGDGLNEEYEDTASNPSDKEPNSGGPIVFKDEGYLQRISELKCEQYIKKTIFFNQDSRRIVKGHPAKQGQFPFMGAVGWEIGNDTANPYEFKCGSTLISEKFVLTTAHCTRLNLLLEKKSTRVIIRPRVVLLGVEDLDPTKVAPDRQGKLVEISKITHYPAYNFVSRYDDIAVMELAEEVVFTQYIYPACLWSRGDIDLVDKVATIAGWGVTNSALSKIENHLQYGEVTILHSSICNISLSDIINRKWMHGIDDKQICAVNAVEGTDTCQGDSGGPLVYYTLPEGYSVKKFPSVVGVTSFGLGCGYVPGVYMRVSSYIDWIEKMVWYN